MPASTLSPTALALGRIPTGIYIVSTRDAGHPLGFVGSFLMQVGFVPPVLCVAVGKDRAHLARLRAAGHFGVSILDPQSGKMMNRFLKPCPAGESPFDGLAVSSASAGSPVLDDALAWLECKVTGEHSTGDHVVVFGEVVDAKLGREGDPSIHLRKNGLAY
jgi:flavin reductase (DIM6/NTAB) family NADH-FMN oxidoreductase RutF